MTTRSEISRRTWRKRKREGGKATCAFCRYSIYAGGVVYQGKELPQIVSRIDEVWFDEEADWRNKS